MSAEAPAQPSGAARAASVPPEGDASVRLLRLFTVLSVLAVVAILVLAGGGIYRVYSIEMTKVAEETAIYVGNSIFEQERATLLRRDGQGVAVVVRPDDFAGLDERMKKFLRTFNMYKIKAFSADKTIVYSTDEKIIGKVEGSNSKLDGTLSAGTVVSQLENKDTVRDLKGEDRFHVDVVETYLPIRVDNVIVGAFEVYTDISSTRDRVLTAIAYTLAVLAVVLVVVFGLLYAPMHKGMVRLRKAEGRLREIASMDALTGIFNRRHVLDRLMEERERMRRVRVEEVLTCMSLLMVDIDHFKRVNDTHGHLVGDDVLQTVSSRLKSSLRAYDVIGRYGGEEFLVVLPATNLVEGMRVAERLRASVRDQPVRCGDLELQVSVSIGVAVTLDADEQIPQLLSRADQGLYKAKEGGRNRVCSVQPVAAAAG
ncbi:MAG: GGDEF domain-containing protein [Betaproteobacteria bacterium]|nr:GGDEF domain-containing protein [Betaproteobacteria bacterium]